jgi:hypothetical protein
VSRKGDVIGIQKVNDFLSKVNRGLVEISAGRHGEDHPVVVARWAKNARKKGNKEAAYLERKVHDAFPSGNAIVNFSKKDSTDDSLLWMMTFNGKKVGWLQMDYGKMDPVFVIPRGEHRADSYRLGFKTMSVIMDRIKKVRKVMSLRETNNLLSEVNHGLVYGAIARQAKPSDVILKPHRKSSDWDEALIVSLPVRGKVIGLLIRQGKTWKGQTKYAGTKKFRGVKAQDRALSAMLKDSPDAVIRKDGR